MARALRAWAIKRRGKNSVRNLRYGPQTRLVRGMYARTVPGAFTAYVQEPEVKSRKFTGTVNIVSISFPWLG